MSKIVQDIKTSTQDYIDNSTESFDTIFNTIRSAMRHLQQHTKFIHAFSCEGLNQTIEVTVEPGDDIGKIYNLRFLVLPQDQIVREPATRTDNDPIKAYERAMRGIG